MWKLAFVCLMLVAMLYAPRLRAQEVDAEGCKDSPLISRFPGSMIHSCENKEYEQADMPIADDGTTKHVEGDYHYWDIGTREGTSDIQETVCPITAVDELRTVPRTDRRT